MAFISRYEKLEALGIDPLEPFAKHRGISEIPCVDTRTPEQKASDSIAGYDGATSEKVFSIKENDFIYPEEIALEGIISILEISDAAPTLTVAA